MRIKCAKVSNFLIFLVTIDLFRVRLAVKDAVRVPARTAIRKPAEIFKRNYASQYYTPRSEYFRSEIEPHGTRVLPKAPEQQKCAIHDCVLYTHTLTSR